MKRVFETAFDFLIPHKCMTCRERLDEPLSLCQDCIDVLPWINSACECCAKPLSVDNARCGDCITHPPHFDKTVSLFRYETPVRQFIMQIKFSEQLRYADLFSRLLVNKIKNRPDFLMPVPLHHWRLRRRGYNQAHVLAQQISRLTNIPIYPHCRRVRHTPAQARQSASVRRRNLKNAFEITKPLHTHRVAIIDDVVTTTQTVREFSKVIAREAVDEIEVWSIARSASTLSDRSNLTLARRTKI